jgi:hypothetical protein
VANDKDSKKSDEDVQVIRYPDCGGREEGENSLGAAEMEVLHLRRRRGDQSFVDAVACLSPRRNPDNHACPGWFC